jgi:hypothetical protein
MDNPIASAVMTGARAALMTLGGSLVTEGLLTNDQLTAIVSGIVTAGVVAWSIMVSHSKANALKAAKGN